MPLSFFKRESRPAPADFSRWPTLFRESRHRAELERAAALMAQSQCGSAIAALKVIDSASSDLAMWVMRTVLYAKRGNEEKMHKCFSHIVRFLDRQKRSNAAGTKAKEAPRSCWMWLPRAGLRAEAWLDHVLPEESPRIRYHVERGCLHCDAAGLDQGQADFRTQLPDGEDLMVRLTAFIWNCQHPPKVLIASVMDGVLHGTPFAEHEVDAYQKLWKPAKTDDPGPAFVIMPEDDELACLSRLYDASVKQVWLARDPALARREPRLKEWLLHWTKKADLMLAGFTMDAIGRWDILMPRWTFVDVAQWETRRTAGGTLRILHFSDTPDYSGTFFLQEVVELLKSQGAAIDLMLVPAGDATARRSAYEKADVFVDGLIVPGYSAFAIEAMAAGLTVVANLESEFHCRVLRRYSFLDECPVVSGSPENIAEVLVRLADDRSLIGTLGSKGVRYVSDRHSVQAAGVIFEQIVAFLDVEHDWKRPRLTNVFHPLIGELGTHAEK